MTHIIIKCKKCGAKEHIPVYGYVQNPIGIPFSRCPYCCQLARTENVAEWIQMTPWTKYISIHPRAGASAFLLGIAFLAIGSVAMGALLLQLLKVFPEFQLPPVILLPLLVLPFLLAHYVIVISRANSDKFIELYCESILRTRNHSYRTLLEQNSVLFDEEIPKWVYLTKGSRAAIEQRLSEETVIADIEFPSLFDVRNSR